MVFLPKIIKKAIQICSIPAEISTGVLNPYLSSMKCTESDDEEPTKGSESQLQLSCFINQEVKYLATGLRLVSPANTSSAFLLQSRETTSGLFSVGMEIISFSRNSAFSK